MKSFLISDNRDTYLGFKLVGIDGVYVQTKEDVSREFDEVVTKGYGIILLTERVYSSIKEKVILVKTNQKLPLITIIPDRHGYGVEKEKITTYIKESIGL